jgi:hypothetical protein
MLRALAAPVLSLNFALPVPVGMNVIPGAIAKFQSALDVAASVSQAPWTLQSIPSASGGAA